MAELMERLAQEFERRAEAAENSDVESFMLRERGYAVSLGTRRTEARVWREAAKLARERRM